MTPLHQAYCSCIRGCSNQVQWHSELEKSISSIKQLESRSVEDFYYRKILARSMIRLLLEDGKLPSLFHCIQENLDPSSRLIPTYEILSATDKTACLFNSVAATLLHSLVDCDQLGLVDPFR